MEKMLRSDWDLFTDLCTMSVVNRQWIQNPDKNYLSFSFGLMVMSGLMVLFGGVLCSFLCRTSPVRSEKERREAQICWSHDQTSPTHLLMRGCAITNIIIMINFRWKIFSFYWTVYQCIFFLERDIFSVPLIHSIA